MIKAFSLRNTRLERSLFGKEFKSSLEVWKYLKYEKINWSQHSSTAGLICESAEKSENVAMDVENKTNVFEVIEKKMPSSVLQIKNSMSNAWNIKQKYCEKLACYEKIRGSW